ncbi:LLM class flavin-dependent oxidoreductase [Kitasatospora sp. NPDC058965]|uniref:LLM class flavin-dependent oxidoreductase n=1 Tax=Kitasatospora sp. NPDC058965 TaxID=3346682 RepID=UPI00368497BF
MRLAVNLGYQGAAELALAAEESDYALALAPEGYRSDAASVLGLLAGRTRRIALGSAVMQLPARPPGLTALTAATLHALSGGRFRLGLGASNPHVATGWYGAAYDHPVARTREYLTVLRRALTGEPVEHRGRYYPLPAGGGPAAAPLHVLTERPGPALPIHLAALGPAMLRLAGELADGWLGVFNTPESLAEAVALLAAGRPGGDLTGFEVLPSLPTAIDPDPRAAVDRLRAHYVYMLGIGAAADNCYCQLAERLGFGPQTALVRARLAVGDRAGAAAAVPAGFVERTALVGPVERVAERMAAYAGAGATTLGVMVTAADTDLAGRVRILRDAARAATLAAV